jgi:hypothetical protein
MRVHHLRYDSNGFFLLGFLLLSSACSPAPDIPRPAIEILYPAATLVGQGFNIQPDGSSALAIKCRNANASSAIVWEGARLVTAFGGPTAISGIVPKDLFMRPGKYRIEILDVKTNVKSDPATFEVK